jgi:dTMP kinase
MSQSDEPLWDEWPSQSNATRVDTAHVRAGEQPIARETAAAGSASACTSESPVAITAHQVRLQAAQLATQLQRQQAAVDHRESELNARSAAVENQIRSARLWLDERHAEMAAKKAELDHRERELEARETQRPDPARNRSGARMAAGDETEIERRAAELDRREAELEQMAARLAQRLDAAEKLDTQSHEAERLKARRENLERAEMLLAGQQAEFERKRRELEEQRARLEEAMQAERRKLAEEQKRTAAEHDRIGQDLKRQSDELSTRHAALERMRSDVKRAQHEALEVRLATEELWSRLCGAMTPAAVAQSLAQVRLKLAEEQRLERAELAAERAEVQALAEQLARQHARLRETRADVEAWVKSRREELERQAGMLAARERQLEEAHRHQQQTAAQWQSERFALEQELCRLLAPSERGQTGAAA